jgi:hypothetical protein
MDAAGVFFCARGWGCATGVALYQCSLDLIVRHGDLLEYSWALIWHVWEYTTNYKINPLIGRFKKPVTVGFPI